MTNGKTKSYLYLFLYLNFLLYSIYPVLIKLAGGYELLTVQALLLYGGGALTLGVYAIFWQQILKRIPLTVAYPNKAVTILLGLVWGALIFGEEIKWNVIVGAVIIVAGVVIMGVDKNEQ